MKKIYSILFIFILAVASVYIWKTSNITEMEQSNKKPLNIDEDIKGNNIIFNTIPKSGSVFISKTLEKSLNYKSMAISPGYFPKDNIAYPQLEQLFHQGSTVTQEHLDASNFNSQMLKKFTDKIIVHVRDPRQVLLSWVHHMNSLNESKRYDLLYYVDPTPPREYYSWSLTKQIDWNIENFLPSVVSWMDGWVKFKKQEDLLDNGFKVLFTTYDEFKADDTKYYNKILDFYDIPRNNFNYISLKKDESLHFRKGTLEEWKQVFTNQQNERIAEIIPEDLLNKFNWSL